MHRPIFLFFLGFSCLCSVYADLESVDCSLVSLADVRKVIPDNAVNAKVFLYKIWNLRKKDICQWEFADWYKSAIFYEDFHREDFQRKSNEKITFGNMFKQHMKELVEGYEERHWNIWVY